MTNRGFYPIYAEIYGLKIKGLVRLGLMKIGLGFALGLGSLGLSYLKTHFSPKPKPNLNPEVCPWIANLRVMWTDRWVMPKCTQNSQSLYQTAIFSPSAKIKVSTLSKTPHPVWPPTHRSSKNFTYGFILGPLQFQSTDQNTHLTSKTAILPVLAFKKNSTHLHSNPSKLSPVSKSSPPTKPCMLFSP